MTGISPNTMTKINRDEKVALSVLIKICEALSVDIGDIIEYTGTNNSITSEEENDA